MAVDGNYTITIHTPIGDQTSKITIKSDGNKISGTTDNPMSGKSTWTGTVNGNEVKWTDTPNTPMGLLKVEMTAKVEGDKISGTSISPFGPAPFEGSRDK